MTDQIAPAGGKVMPVAQAIALAAEHQEAGRLAQAESICRQILAAKPDNPDALHLLGIIAHAAGKAPLAVELIGRAIAGDSRKALYHSNLAEIHRRHGRTEEALASARRAMVLEPGNPQVLNNFAIALYDHRDYARGEALLRKTVELHPKYAEAHSNLGNAIRAQHRREEAIAWYRRAIKLKPRFADALANLGTTLKDLGEYAEAMACFDEAIAIDPKHGNARSGRALVLLLQGDYANGLREYEWRWHSSEMRPRNFVQPAWQGEALAGRRLLVHAEQGLGDTMQFCRYLPTLRDRGGSVIFEVQPGLLTFMAANFPWARVIPHGSLPPFDQQCPLLSLARLSGTTPATIPADVPYLLAEKAAAARWAARLDGRRLRVGFVWTGNPDHPNDHNRSLPIEQLSPLFDLPDISFCSLQTGPRAGDLGRLTNFGSGLDLSGELVDFAETAAVVANLDLVVAVDTAVAHLAGAMGKPVWLMLPRAPDWRWMLEREDSPWYPTARLFRQPQAGDWDSVIARIAEDLRAVAGGDKEKLLPLPGAR
ncbi:MAG: hypothetical protein QOK29_420 [Rhodospirillaceae bacterium]|nr:hypothetical protein [Rhodospirillaceae bacterium]